MHITRSQGSVRVL